jgi:citrate lyase subunit beta/citryl-CoA lyase
MTHASIGKAGNDGEKDRSDCLITVELAPSGGVQVSLVSKVQALFGDSIIALGRQVADFFEIQHARITIADKGALPFVLAARLEAAIKKVMPTDKEFLLDMLPENTFPSMRDKHRFSRLYLPGNTPGLMINAGLHKPNAIILDLEDAVAHDKKDEARFLVRNALRSVDFKGAERMVRINQLPDGLEDLDVIIPHQVHVVLVPKCENARQLKLVNDRIAAIMQNNSHNQPVWLMPIVESALGVVNVFEIASSENVVAVAIGLEDYTADLGVNRTPSGTESLFARYQLVNACKAAGVQPIDSVFSDVADTDGLTQYVIQSKALGFEGMGCIHPRQIRVIHEHFAPGVQEIEYAKKVVTAFELANQQGLGVVSLGTKMIDAPRSKTCAANDQTRYRDEQTESKLEREYY